MTPSIPALLAAAGLAASSFAFTATDVAPGSVAEHGDRARAGEPIVLTGADLPDWSGLPAEGTPATYPSGHNDDHPAGDDLRSAHNGTLTVPAGPAGVDPDRVRAYRYDAEAASFVEIPVQVDERYPYFLANGRSDFSFYSGTDVELTYAFNPTADAAAEEAWKKVAGACLARYPESVEEIDALIEQGVITLGEGETREDYLGAMPDPAVGLDLDDEVVFLAGDAGAVAPDGVAAPEGVDASSRQTVLLQSPTPVGSMPSAVYLFLADEDSEPTFTHENGYVEHVRDADADRWMDRSMWADSDPEKLGTSNTGYGANLDGTVCGQLDTPYDELTDGEAATAPTRPSTDRFPLDGVTIRTASYEAYASGRWMFRSMAVAQPEDQQNKAAQRKAQPGEASGEARFAPRAYGDDLVDRWKGRAFQQSPDSVVSLVGFEDEQVNWEANSSLLGWKVGPVRAIREIWGADSGTNVTKIETFSRDLAQHRYIVRVHPIPPDGLYTSWDYNRDAASTYYNALRPEGVAIDGQNDDVGQVDDVFGNPAFFDAPDPTFDIPSALYRWEQVAGKAGNGSLVYSVDLTGATTVTNPLVVPYYRDDECLDDGTGDDPVARPWPGEASTDQRVKDGYAAMAGEPYEELECSDRQGAYAAHGLHFFLTGDSDNAFVNAPTPLTEIDARQWQFAVPMSTPTNVGESYADVVRTPTVARVLPSG